MWGSWSAYLGRAPIDAGRELITVKVYLFKIAYYAVRIKELRHTKHPVWVGFAYWGNSILPYM